MKQASLLPEIEGKNDDHTVLSKGFSGTDNPRHLRALHVLMIRPLLREELDRAAGCSNGPDIVCELRRRGLEIPCQRIAVLDRDGEVCRPGVYRLTASDRRKVAASLRRKK